MFCQRFCEGAVVSSSVGCGFALFGAVDDELAAGFALHAGQAPASGTGTPVGIIPAGIEDDHRHLCLLQSIQSHVAGKGVVAEFFLGIDGSADGDQEVFAIIIRPMTAVIEDRFVLRTQAGDESVERGIHLLQIGIGDQGHRETQFPQSACNQIGIVDGLRRGLSA